MPAARKPTGEQTTAVLGLRLTPAEREQVDTAARKAGQSFSSYARQALVQRLIVDDVRGYIAAISSRLHDRARQLSDDALFGDRRDERATLLHELADALIACLPDAWWEPDRDDPEEGA